MNNLSRVLTSGFLALSGATYAEDGDNAILSPLRQGFYIAPMASYTLADNRWNTKDGLGGSLAGGYRIGTLAIEVSGAYASLGASAAPRDIALKSVGINALVFPLTSFLPNLYLLGGAAYVRGNNLFIKVADTNGPLLPPAASSKTVSFSAQYLQAGLGHIFPLSIGRYDFGIRAEALARYTERRDRNENTANDPRHFLDYVFGLGLQLPIGQRQTPVSPPVEPVQVVPVEEAAPVPVETVPPPSPPCQPPAPGQPINLAGCKAGDTLVLRGVNFEFNKATLTVNARALLDPVADALLVRPDIKVEVDGHTDSKGSDAYNLKLSEHRAASVMNYLAERGVAAAHMSSKGYGESLPVADNATDEGREYNRRVELKIIESAGGVAVAPVAGSLESTTEAPAAAEADAAGDADAVPETESADEGPATP